MVFRINVQTRITSLDLFDLFIIREKITTGKKMYQRHT